MSTESPILRIDLESAVPVYEQLSNGIRSELVAGRLRPGDQLPTVRELALDLGVHHNTVAEAYRLLAREGWLDLRRGRGALVIARQQPEPSEQARTEFARRLRELAAKAIAQGVPKPEVAGEMKALSSELDQGDHQ
jgi:GntR family transcriptional regulator